MRPNVKPRIVLAHILAAAALMPQCPAQALVFRAFS